MKHIALAFSLFLLTLPMAASAQSTGCTTGQLASGMRAIEQYFRSTAPSRLFVTQLVLREGGKPGIAPDGKWGPVTRDALCEELETYSAINGAVLVRAPADVPDFTDWIASMTYFSLYGGEAPD